MQKIFLWVACFGMSTAYATESNLTELNAIDLAVADTKEIQVSVDNRRGAAMLITGEVDTA